MAGGWLCLIVTHALRMQHACEHTLGIMLAMRLNISPALFGDHSHCPCEHEVIIRLAGLAAIIAWVTLIIGVYLVIMWTAKVLREPVEIEDLGLDAKTGGPAYNVTTQPMLKTMFAGDNMKLRHSREAAGGVSDDGSTARVSENAVVAFHV
jgi:hypothetical protein